MRKFIYTLIAALSLAASSAWAQPVNYQIDPTHTFVTFEVSHMGTSTNRGRFDKKQGTVQLDKGKSGKVELSIDMDSISTGTPAFDKHLRGPDFFDTERYPTARFSADKFVFNGDKVSEVSGTLTLLGKTNPVTLKASNFNCYLNPMFKREVCGGDFETTIDRSAYGINYAIQWGVPKEVRLIVQVEAVKE